MEFEEVKRRLDAAAPAIEANKQKEKALDQADLDEMNLLISYKPYKNMPLNEDDDTRSPKGPTIRINMGLTADEVEHLAEVLATSSRAFQEGRFEEADDLTFEALSMALYGDGFTVEWFREHKKELPLNNMKRCIQLAYQVYLDSLVRAKAAVKFRNEAQGKVSG